MFALCRDISSIRFDHCLLRSSLSLFARSSLRSPMDRAGCSLSTSSCSSSTCFSFCTSRWMTPAKLSFSPRRGTVDAFAAFDSLPDGPSSLSLNATKLGRFLIVLLSAVFSFSFAFRADFSSLSSSTLVLKPSSSSTKELGTELVSLMRFALIMACLPTRC